MRLNEAEVETITRSFGREFQIGTIRLAIKNFLTFVLAIGTTIFNEWPRNDLLELRLKKSAILRQFKLWTMLKHMTRSAIRRLCSRLCSFSLTKRSWYGRCWQPGTRLVIVRWTLSICNIWATWDGDHVVDAYSTSGRTYTLKALTRLSGFLERKHRKISALRWLAVVVILLM